MTATTTATTRWGLYTRISDDRHRDERGVRRQRNLIVDDIVDAGGEVIDTYSDNSVSASKGLERVDYDRMLSDLRSGRIDGAAFLDSDRFTRDPEEGETFLRFAVDHGIAVRDSTGSYNFAKPEDRRRWRDSYVNAAYETDKLSVRVKRSVRALARDGEPTGPAPYGWRYFDSPHRVQRFGARPVCDADHDHGATVCQHIDPPPPPRSWPKSCSVSASASRTAQTGCAQSPTT